MKKLRDYQIEIAEKAKDLLYNYKIAYLAMQVRTGKTATALETCKLFDVKKVLFITKKRAISSIIADHTDFDYKFEIVVINYESLHTILDNDFDLLIVDESHKNGSFPKPNKVTKLIKQRFSKMPLIMLSGTPAIESGSQFYHQFHISDFSPFREYKNFYAWAKVFTNPKIKHLGALKINDYSDAKLDLILPIIDKYLLKYTQKEAGFEAEITENILYCEMTEKTNELIKRLLNDNVIEGNSDCIVADTPVKLMSKIHQLSNGTVILESGKSIILDISKAVFIKNYFANKKIAIFYNFQKELELIQQIFGNITTDLYEFNSTDKTIALQQVAGSEGISLKQAEAIVYYSFGYSGKNYVQSRDRMTTMNRAENNIYFVFQKGDINEKIYKAIKSKKKYNEKLFIKDYGTRTRLAK